MFDRPANTRYQLIISRSQIPIKLKNHLVIIKERCRGMELLAFSCSSSYSCQIGSLNWKFVEKKLNSSRSKFILTRRAHVVYARTKPRQKLFRGFERGHLNHLKVKNIDQQGVTGLLRPGEGFTSVINSNILSVNYNNYVVDGNQDLSNISERVGSPPKVLIPGLPDDSGGNCGSSISSCFWEWKPKFSVHYEKSGSENVNSPAVLFLPGFGVGSFHYEKQLKDLGCDFRVWALDFLGQGRSLPSEDPAPLTTLDVSEEKDQVWGFGEKAVPWANELVYSMDLWCDQVRDFVEQVVGEPVYIVGNSLGGFVALYFAACNPQLVKGITLLNATPFWGFLPNPVRSPGLAKIFPWAGTFPLPSSVRKLTEIVWQKISDPRSIREVLKQVYADHSTKIDEVFSRILETTEHPAAAASFASIMFAPRGQLSFQESLIRCQMNSVPICLMYGKEDPWVKPVWGLKVKQQVPEAPYYEISPAGHCPHDEVPEVVNYLLRGWIMNLESQGSVALPLLDSSESVQHDILSDVEFVKEGSRKSVRVRFFGSNFSVWNQIRSYFKSRIAN